jgi:nucleotidyltransferase substrate binding protein (TIGR01987 family)
MTIDRTKELLADYEKAFSRLQEAIASQIESDLLVDAVIQRFEFTFELSWKLMKSYLNFQGIECNSPRQSIKEAFRLNLIKNGDAWIDMMMDRNKTSHIYDEQEASSIYNKIISTYVDLFASFLDRMKQEF